MAVRLAPYHTPVLRDEVVAWLLTPTGTVYVDATLGGGGHAESILQRLHPTGVLVGLDADPDAIQFSTARLSTYQGQAVLVHSNFRDVSAVLAQRDIHRISGILFDLGVSSYQLDEPSRGFSFRTDEQLDMRMDRTLALDARSIVNHYDEQELADVLWMYGEERASRKIAHALVRRRTESPLQTTGELAAVVREIVGERFLVKSLARVFQALRIEVNNELMSLEAALAQAIALLKTGGRIVVISYHSLEDRIVKDTFKREAAASIPSGHKLVPDTPLQPAVRILTKKPITASEEECSRNSRARSAKMRVAERL
jgi:16S rRNA (cytosine1402-N4)-methyltransferase